VSLLGFQSAWIGKFDEMQKVDDQQQLAAPFLSVPGGPDALAQFGPVMLVGKATAGCWKLDEFKLKANRPLDERVAERRCATEKHLELMRQHPSSAFWRFWTSLGALGSPVIWTNLAKIGVIKGNPWGSYLAAQAGLACATLRAEIDEYKPSLVLIAADYAKCEIIYPVFGERATWNERADHEFCWIDRKSSRPAVLWTDHPERKRKTRISRWLEKAQELVSQSS
jgi:hypothetical protein